MSKRWPTLVLCALASCASTAPSTEPAPAPTLAADTWSVLVDLSVEYAGTPLTFRVVERSGSPPRHAVEIEAHPGQYDWELYAEIERVGSSLVLLAKLLQPGPGIPFVPNEAPLQYEIPLDPRPERLHILAVLWMKDVSYTWYPRWDVIGVLNVPRPPG